MKKFAKIMIIVAAVFLTAGIGLSAAGAAMGASMDKLDVVEELKTKYTRLKAEVGDEVWEDDQDEDDWDDDDWHEYTHNNEDSSHNSGSGDGTYEYTSIDEIEVELKYDTLVVETHDEDMIRVVVENDPDGDIRVWNEGLELKIEGRNTKTEGRMVTIYCPNDTSLVKFSADVNAGVVEIADDLSADEVDIQVGAGEFTNNGNITAREFDAEVGVGNVEIQNIIADKISAECGTGSLTLGVKGNQEDYRYKLECDLGAITIGNDEYTSLTREEIINNQGAAGVMELECGLGQITVDFS